mmetsp:Transcript_2185/g.3596  ORF Transcript_2185/g.3596 Transcript_2185/m.3596 type:complete len:275 (+) Transcript_2185:63-887(+)
MTTMVITLKLQQLLRALLSRRYHELPEDVFAKLLTSLEKSCHHAQSFNMNMALRTTLWKCGFMKLTRRPSVSSVHDPLRASAPVRLPHLLEQETNGYTALLGALFRMYTKWEGPPKKGAEAPSGAGGGAEDEKSSEVEQPLDPAWMNGMAEPRLQSVCKLVMKRYIAAEQDIERLDSNESDFLDEEIEALVPVVKHALQGVKTFSEAQFRKHANWLYSLICNLVKCRDHEVRVLVSDIMRRQLASLLPLEVGVAASAGASTGDVNASDDMPPSE